MRDCDLFGEEEKEEPLFCFVSDPKMSEVSALVEQFHYSGYVPTNVQYCAGLELNGQLVAGIIYTIPATRWSEKVFELARLVRHPDYTPPLTKLISKSVKELRRRKGADLIVSFADSTHQHHGGVYQAASWNFHEKRKPSCDAFYVDGQLVPRRTCNHRYGTSSVKEMAEIAYLFGFDCKPHYDTGKILYWRSLDKNGSTKAERLGLKSQGYIKPLFGGPTITPVTDEAANDLF